MGVIVKHLKQLKNGRWQYRRVWPSDTRKALPNLTLEVKKTFPEGASREAAIRWGLEQDRKADALIAKVRSGALELETDEKTVEAVVKWFNERRGHFDDVVVSSWSKDDLGRPIEITETNRDLERSAILERAERRSGVAPDGSPKSLTREEELQLEALKTDTAPSVSMTINRAFDFYVERHLGGREDKATEAAREQSLEHFGDIPLERVTRASVSDWTQALARRRGQSAATIRRRIGALKAVFNFAKDQGRFSGDNPLANLKPPKFAEAPLERMPFHRVHLEAIETHLSGPRIRDETRDLVGLLQFTGCRPSEIGGLKVEDLQLQGNVPYAVVRWTPDRRLKTVQSNRRVPLLGAALEGAREAAKRQGSGWLFPSLAPSSGELNDNPLMSARVNKLIRRAGIFKTPRLVAYSFRHTMAEALDRAGIGQVVRDRVLGKQKADRYGANELPVTDALSAMKKALPLLGEIDVVEYTEDEPKVDCN